MNLPVITERNFSTLIHERYNADWIEEEKMGIVLTHFSRVASAVEQFLDENTFRRYQQNVSEYKNKAVEEVCDLIEALLAKGAPACPREPHQVPHPMPAKTITPSRENVSTSTVDV